MTANENRRLKRMYTEMSIQNDLLKESVWQKALRPSLRKEMVVKVLAAGGVTIALACRTFWSANAAIGMNAC